MQIHKFASAALAINLVALCAATPGSKTENRVLLGLKQPSRLAASRDVSGLGEVVGLDQESKMFVVQLSSKTTLTRAIAKLKKRSGVAAVLPISAREIDKTSLRSVSDHVKYLRAFEGEEEHKSKGRDKADFYASLQYFLEKHVRAGTDYVDEQAYKSAYLHASEMPKAAIGGSSIAPSSLDVSGTWAFIGPNNLGIPYQQYFGTPPVCGRISCVAYDPTTSSVIYAGSGDGGLWKTTNAGVNWSCITDKSPWKYGAVDSIAIDPKNHDILYVGTGDFDGYFNAYTQGIMKSTDGGVTWTDLGASTSGIYNMSVSRIVVDPQNSSIITCTTGRGSYGGVNVGTGNVWRSTNAGATWTSAGLIAGNYSALDISVPGKNNVETYWVAGAKAAHAGLLYKSVNHGATWTAVTPPDAGIEVAWTLAASKVSSSTLYVLATVSHKVYKSTNGGTSWTNITNGAPFNSTYNWSQSDYDYDLGTQIAPNAPAGEVVFCGLITFAYSINGGTTWVDYGDAYNGPVYRIHSDQHQFAASASDSSQVVEGCDGGLFRLKFTWTDATPTVALAPLNADLGITQYYKIAPHATNSSYVLGGAQDNASPSAFGNLTSWANLQGGDGGYCGYDYPLGLLFTTSDQGGLFTYDLTGHNMNEATGDSISAAEFVAPTVLSNDGNTIYVGADVMYTADLTAATLALTAGTTQLTASNGAVNAIAIAKSDGNRIYTGGNDGSVFMSTDGNVSWNEIDENVLPGASVGAIAVQPGNENDVLVAFQNTGVTHLYRSTNTSVTTPAWTPVAGSGGTGLPDVPVNAIVLSPFAPTTTWYVGTDVGVFVTTNSGSTWANVSGGLPNTIVEDLKYGNGYLYAGTFGRGMWRVPLDGIVSFTINPATVIGGNNSDAIVDLITTAGASGEVVNISCSRPDIVTVQPAMRIAAGKGSGSFPIVTQPVAIVTQVTIGISCGASRISNVLTLTP